MEDYAAKMLLKTDAALREYVTGHVQYREAAVLAALDELHRRGLPAPEEASLRPALETGAAAQRILDEAAAAKHATTRSVPTEADGIPADAPVLYSPLAVIIFSILSVPIGGILLAINLFRLGKKPAMLTLLLFIAAYMLAVVGLFGRAFESGTLTSTWPLMGLNLMATLVYMQWFWARYVGGTVFRSRSTLVPIVVCLLLVWAVQKISPALMQPPGRTAPMQQRPAAR